MNDPHKFGTEFGSDNAQLLSVTMTASNGLRQSPENNCVFGFTEHR
jgi:hypothetical protein